MTNLLTEANKAVSDFHIRQDFSFQANSKTSSPVSADFITGEEIPSQPPEAVSVTERQE